MARRTNGDLKEEYLRWLESQLKDELSPQTTSLWGLTNVLAEREFEQKVPMDDNRIQDGLDLRYYYATEVSPTSSARLDRLLGPVSFLEVLIGLSRRMAFQAGGSPGGWAWVLLGNLELQKMTDPLTRVKQVKIERVMETVINRSYSPDGRGGFFPLAWPDEDQTRVELWYQLHAYIAELHPEHSR